MRKRILSVFLALAFCLTVLPVGVWAADDAVMTTALEAAESFAGGDGTADNPYEIATAEQLKLLAEKVNAGDTTYNSTYYKLTADIDLGCEEWTPIGNSETRFSGTFDGDGHLICGLYINASESNHQGLFGYVYNGGTINSTVENCYNTGSVSGSSYVGGIVGYNNATTNGGCYVEYCYNIGEVSETSQYVGGIVGNTYATWDVRHCYYLSTCNANGTTFTNDYGDSMTEAQFNSGEVAWLLQNGQSTLVWGQQLNDAPNNDKFPIFTDNTDIKVLKVTFAAKNGTELAAAYTNHGGTVELPEVETNAYKVISWSQINDENGDEFTEETVVTGDMTVYAIGQEMFGANDGDITITADYGEGKETDLSELLDEHIEYADGTSSSGNFDYSIKEDKDNLGATVKNNVLIVPDSAKAGTYELIIIAEEKQAHIAPISVSYGTETVEFTVIVIIE